MPLQCVLVIILDPRSVDVKKICLQRFSCREKSFQCPKDMYPYWHQEKRGLDFEGMMAGIEKMKESLSHFFECLALMLELTTIDMLDSYQWPWEFTPKCFHLAVVNQRKKTETVSQEGECILLHAARMQRE